MRIAIAFVAACSAPPHTHPARTGPSLRCELRDYTIRSVDGYFERVNSHKASVDRLRGAALFVEAQRGLTAEWLHLQLERHIEAARTAAPTPDCPLDVDDPSVTVVSSGPGFIVRLSVANEDDADEILRRARGLVAPRTSDGSPR